MFVTVEIKEIHMTYNKIQSKTKSPPFKGNNEISNQKIPLIAIKLTDDRASLQIRNILVLFTVNMLEVLLQDFTASPSQPLHKNNSA